MSTPYANNSEKNCKINKIVLSRWYERSYVERGGAASLQVITTQGFTPNSRAIRIIKLACLCYLPYLAQQPRRAETCQPLFSIFVIMVILAVIPIIARKILPLLTFQDFILGQLPIVLLVCILGVHILILMIFLQHNSLLG